MIFRLCTILEQLEIQPLMYLNYCTFLNDIYFLQAEGGVFSRHVLSTVCRDVRRFDITVLSIYISKTCLRSACLAFLRGTSLAWTGAFGLFCCCGCCCCCSLRLRLPRLTLEGWGDIFFSFQVVIIILLSKDALKVCYLCLQ